MFLLMNTVNCAEIITSVINIFLFDNYPTNQNKTDSFEDFYLLPYLHGLKINDLVLVRIKILHRKISEKLWF
jgi:hypothetical protein